MKLLMFTAIILLTWFFPLAQDANASNNLSGSKRQTVIDFEEGLIEGVNKRPLDSLQSLSQQQRLARKHLYRKRASFRSEIQSTFSETDLPHLSLKGEN